MFSEHCEHLKRVDLSSQQPDIRQTDLYQTSATCKSRNNPWLYCENNVRRCARFRNPPADPTRGCRTLVQTPGVPWTGPAAKIPEVLWSLSESPQWGMMRLEERQRKQRFVSKPCTTYLKVFAIVGKVHCGVDNRRLTQLCSHTKSLEKSTLRLLLTCRRK